MLKHSDKGAKFTDLVLEIFRMNGALLAAGDALCQGTGLTSARWQIMGMIDDTPKPVPNIARLMGLTRQGVQRTVNILVSEGLVELLPNPHHKTAKLVALTGDGRAKLEIVQERQIAWANQISNQLDLNELNHGADLLGKIRADIENHS